MDLHRIFWGCFSCFLAVIACLICILQSICGFLANLVLILAKWIYVQFSKPRVQSLQDEVDYEEQQDVREDQGQWRFLQDTNVLTDFFGFQKGWSKEIRFHKMVIGNDMNCHKAFLSGLGINRQDAEFSADQSDVIIAFVPIASRAGTDIVAALEKIPENRPVVFVALHHTFDRNCVVPESRRNISRSNVLAVDCLFHEDQGLLECPCNTEALKATVKYLQDIKMNSKVSRWF
ncbi:uncharacterized protein LOC128602908 isoform X2 [Ictalurus furcatus]|uniref:uncharacterized protein LOC128602908 isoform X2 n=1 Tax=Ictalurus furcatus TaxID=66913 RepID=UPI00234FCA4C|nr:uncharacterized protein LOC128602908 isoform X2 [Ictalurus furcatus]